MMFIGLLVLFLALTTVSAQNECSDRNANCINIRDCVPIITILRGPRPLSAQALHTLRNSQCGFQGHDPMVCCPSQTTSTTATPTAATITTPEPKEVPPPPDVTNHPNLRLLNHKLCGPVTQQRVIGGNKTGIFDYPWMALIAYDTGKPNPEFRCGGTIISTRYILTAAHCVTTLPPGVRLIGARVGDHDISKERDCEKDDKGVEQCAERYQNFRMESFHFHPEYTTTRLQNDIALIRLTSSMDFKPRNIKPICLPFGTAATLNQKKAIVTGWGVTGRFLPRSQDLLQAKLPLMTNEQCKEAYKRNTEIWYKQVCAGGQLNVDSCPGDSGGPLQAPGIYNGKTLRTIQHGVVSYGLKNCGTEGFPGVYTRVAYYMDWILNTMTD